MASKFGVSLLHFPKSHGKPGFVGITWEELLLLFYTKLLKPINKLVKLSNTFFPLKKNILCKDLKTFQDFLLPKY